MWIDVDWFGDTGFFDFGGDIWQLTPDGLGGYVAMPFDPVSDLAAGILAPVILALPIIGMIMVGAPLAICLGAALLGVIAGLLAAEIVHPIAGFGLLSTCLTYALGTLSWALGDMFETHNPIFLFGYIGMAAVVLIVWAGLGSIAQDFEDLAAFWASSSPLAASSRAPFCSSRQAARVARRTVSTPSASCIICSSHASW